MMDAASIATAFLDTLREFAYRAWQDRRGNTDYNVNGIDAEDFRAWFDRVVANAAQEQAALDFNGMCFVAWRASNERTIDDAGWERWWDALGIGRAPAVMSFTPAKPKPATPIASTISYTSAPIGHREIVSAGYNGKMLRCSCGLLLTDHQQLAEHHARVRKQMVGDTGAPDIAEAGVAKRMGIISIDVRLAELDCPHCGARITLSANIETRIS